MSKAPNIVFIFSDEWRAQATGYNGDPNCNTPVIDAFAEQSVNLTNALSGCPVCCPYRGSLMTGQYPLTHGIFINDVELDPNCNSIAMAFNAGGYETAYIGKWHIYGSPEGKRERRQHRVPRSHQMGFDTWMGYECCHDYWQSPYYINDDPTEYHWEAYDAFAQSEAAAKYIRDHSNQDKPFMLMLSWGPPHFPMHTAPEEYRERFKDKPIELRPNVPEEHRAYAEEELRGYYAHIEALDDAFKTVLDAVDEADRENTIVIFTSDHGEMCLSQGLEHKLYAFDESIRVPFLMRYPALFNDEAQELTVPIDGPDIMPTLLGFAGLDCPSSVEGKDWSPWIKGEKALTGDEAGYLNMSAQFTWLCRLNIPPYRGLRTARYTYTITHDGPQYLFDNEVDPYQMTNFVNASEYKDIREKLHAQLIERMAERKDEFLPGETYLEQAGYTHYKECNEAFDYQWEYPWQVAEA